EATRIMEAVVGAHHPNLGLRLEIEAFLAICVGDIESAGAAATRSLDILEAAYGSGSRTLGSSLYDLGWVRFLQGRFGEARRLAERGVAVAGGDKHNRLVNLTLEAQVAEYQGRLADALALGTEAAAAAQEIYGPENEVTGTALYILGEIQVRHGDIAAARATL